MAGDTIKTRIQLKNDTETNWDKATNFVPRKGEAIIYLADGTHPFSRLKIGDGSTTVTNLPFIAAAQADTAQELAHKLTFGNNTYVFDGTADVTVPVYNGNYL